MRRVPHVPLRTRNALSDISVDVSEVQHILSKLDINKALGSDGVSPHLLRNCAQEVAPILTTIFQYCLKKGKWPQIWKVARIVPVHKKEAKSLPKNYRPISLLPIQAKIFEEIIIKPMKEFLNKNRLLSERQFGFTAGKSSSDLLLLMTQKWVQHLDKTDETRVIALDIAGAFDTVWHEGLLAKMKSLGFSGKLFTLLESYLAERSLCVVLSGVQSKLHPVKAGVPQGSLLGPLLWNIFFNDLLQQFPESVAYADDLTIHISYPPLERSNAADRLQSIIEAVSNWGQMWQMKFAAEKSQSLVISRRSDKARGNKTLYMNKHKLLENDIIEILGVSFDSTLSFKTHIENLARQASKKVAALRRILQLLTPDGALQLYKSQIRSKLEYACLAWGGAAKTHLALLDNVQKRALRLVSLATGPEPSAPLGSLQQRRDVAGLTVLFKAQQLHTPHLAPLKQQHTQQVYHTRAMAVSNTPLALQTANSSQYQRSFVYRYNSVILFV